MGDRQALQRAGLVAALLASLAAGATAQKPDDEYRRLVARYRSGDRDAASELADAASSGRLRRVRCEGGGACQAAAVLNLEAASLLLKATRVDLAADLIDATRALVNTHSSGPAFDWLMAAGLLHQSYGDHGNAFPLLAAALELRPGNPSALLARATALEFSVIPDGFGAVLVSDRDVWRLLHHGDGNPPRELSSHIANPGTETPYRRMLLEFLTQQYRNLLDDAPVSSEARLRLGRVLEARGRRAEAEVELRAVAARGEDPFLAAIALLCLARFESSPAGAAAAYRSALEANWALSPAWLGLSQSLHASGDRAAALDALERALALGENRPGSAWMDHHFGHGRSFPVALEALRAKLKPPS